MPDDDCRCADTDKERDAYAVLISKVIEDRARQESLALGPQLDALRLVAKARKAQEAPLAADRPSEETLRGSFRRMLRSAARFLRL